MGRGMSVGLLGTVSERKELGRFYRQTLLENVIPFWLRHGLDRELCHALQHGGAPGGMVGGGARVRPILAKVLPLGFR
jgi:hypothetical protein